MTSECLYLLHLNYFHGNVYCGNLLGCQLPRPQNVYNGLFTSRRYGSIERNEEFLYPTCTYELPSIIQHFTQIQLILRLPIRQLKLRPVIYIQFMLKLETTFFLCLETSEIFGIFKNWASLSSLLQRPSRYFCITGIMFLSYDLPVSYLL